MQLADGVCQILRIRVNIYLRGAQMFVPEQGLHDGHRGDSHEFGRESVTQYVRVNRSADGFYGCCLDDSLELPGGYGDYDRRGIRGPGVTGVGAVGRQERLPFGQGVAEAG